MAAHPDQRSPQATRTQFDDLAVLPYYAYLAATGVFVENHCSGFGTNSTPNHLLLVGGQTPTLRNPPRTEPPPLWDMPSLPGHAGDHGLSWKVYTGASGYPVSFYTQLKDSPNVVGSDLIVAEAADLPALSMVWHDPPFDEHPVADVSLGQGKVWQAVDAIVAAGHWDTTVFLLTWDDWGGWHDHVVTPDVEHTPDGVQLAFGPRVPLIVFGGRVRPGIDSRWSSHVSVGRTVLELLGLPRWAFPGWTTPRAWPTSCSPIPARPRLRRSVSRCRNRSRPRRRPIPRRTPPPPTPTSAPVGPVVLRDGSTLPPPDDQPVG